MAGGPTMNLLLAFALLFGVTATYGVYRSQLTVNRVQECIVAADATDRSCAGKPKTPAYLSGIQPGDTVVAFNGRPIDSWEQMSEAIRGNLDGPAQITVERAGQTVQLKPVNTVINGVRRPLGSRASGSRPASSGSSRWSSGSAAARSSSCRTCGR